MDITANIMDISNIKPFENNVNRIYLNTEKNAK